MNRHPSILTLAGSDSSGGAGIQADLKAISANGGYAASVLTAITAQNTCGVTAAQALPVELIRAQIDAVFTDLDVHAAKTGMLASVEVIQEVADGLRRHAPPFYVCDPVMISKTGFPLLGGESIETLMTELLPLATLVTPNVHEAQALAGIEIHSLRDAEIAGRRLLERGARAVLVKGGHLAGSPGTDVLVTSEGVHTYHGTWVESHHTHGTGCTYSAAIATHLGLGVPLHEAVSLAKAYVTEAIRGGLPVGFGTGPTHHFFFMSSPEAAARWSSRLASAHGGGR